MTLRTALTGMFGIEHPIVLAPMGGVAGGALAAAVSEAGGLGVIGGGLGDREWMDREVALAAAGTGKPWGIGLLIWGIDTDTVSWVIDRKPSAIVLSFGDPTPYAAAIRDAGIRLLVQVTDSDEAARALDAGADVLIAQGSEAGGHCGGRATLPFVPSVVDMAESTPVLAAGGIADGRGLAAALTLGAAGALIGTRFEATHEALISAHAAKAIVAARAGDTERNRTLDIARGSAWPAEYPARTLRNGFLDRWRGRDAEMIADSIALQQFRDAATRDDLDYVPVWAGESVDLIDQLESAGEVVRRIGHDAEAVLRRTAEQCVDTPR
ncbi:NAD(P)H-dependent flavin oxidoreductase [Nocardia australiensis]|uniref:NAD(P)H-dependent flavin oxidoreductase n=1 Tax=Nocardia australiensis TaxID=2887191 RepID=UPI001D14B181|nr:nitronate monooxygenase [Nocardia australiensis]